MIVLIRQYRMCSSFKVPLFKVAHAFIKLVTVMFVVKNLLEKVYIEKTIFCNVSQVNEQYT